MEEVRQAVLEVEEVGPATLSMTSSAFTMVLMKEMDMLRSRGIGWGLPKLPL